MGAVLDHTAEPGEARTGRFIVPCPVCGESGCAVQSEDLLALDMCMLCSGYRKVSRVSAERYHRARGQLT